VQVWAEQDRTPPWEGRLDLTDAETGKRMELEFDEAARARYTAAFDGHAEALRRLATRNSGRYAGVSTTTPVEEALFGPLREAVCFS